MSVYFSERKFIQSIIIAFAGLGISLVVGFIIVLFIEHDTTMNLINTLFFTPDVAEYINPVVLFITIICLYTTPGPGLIIWLINVDPNMFFGLVSGILAASILTWTIVGILIGYITRNPQRSLFLGILTVIFSLVFTIIMELVSFGSAGLLFTGIVGVTAIGIIILMTVAFSLIMVVYCAVISAVSATLINKFVSPEI